MRIVRPFRNVAVALLISTGAFNGLRAADSGVPEQTAAQLASRALTNSSTMEIITSLTTEIGPRLDGSPAEKRAAEWAKNYCEKLGFDKVWVETFQLEHGWERGIEKAEIT